VVAVAVFLSLSHGNVEECIVAIALDVDVAVGDEVAIVDVFNTSTSWVLVDPTFVTMTVELQTGTCGIRVSHESIVSVTEGVDKLVEVVGRTGDCVSVTYFVTVWMMVVSMHEHSLGTAAAPILPEVTVVVLLTVVVGV